MIRITSITDRAILQIHGNKPIHAHIIRGDQLSGLRVSDVEIH